MGAILFRYQFLEIASDVGVDHNLVEGFGTIFVHPQHLLPLLFVSVSSTDIAGHYVIFQEKKKTEAEVQRSEDASDAKGDKEDGVITSRCLNIQEKKKTEAEVQSSENASDAKGDKDHQVITLRPLNMEDMRLAKSQVAASFAAEGSIMSELKEWNELFGEGGSRKKQQLTYFL